MLSTPNCPEIPRQFLVTLVYNYMVNFGIKHQFRNAVFRKMAEKSDFFNDKSMNFGIYVMFNRSFFDVGPS